MSVRSFVFGTSKNLVTLAGLGDGLNRLVMRNATLSALGRKVCDAE